MTDIDWYWLWYCQVLIDSLPGEESTAELQAAGLQQLEQDSEAAGEQLRATVKQGEELLTSLQAALSNIHTAQLEMQKIAAEEFIEAYTGANTLWTIDQFLFSNTINNNSIGGSLIDLQ